MVMRDDRPIRLSHTRWLAADAADRSLTIDYSDHDAFWQVIVEDDPNEHLARDLREALAEATALDVDEPWVVVVADAIEDDLANEGESGERR
jgi:hypothetical protein